MWFRLLFTYDQANWQIFTRFAPIPWQVKHTLEDSRRQRACHRGTAGHKSDVTYCTISAHHMEVEISILSRKNTTHQNPISKKNIQTLSGKWWEDLNKISIEFRTSPRSTILREDFLPCVPRFCWVLKCSGQNAENARRCWTSVIDEPILPSNNALCTRVHLNIQNTV